MVLGQNPNESKHHLPWQQVVGKSPGQLLKPEVAKVYQAALMMDRSPGSRSMDFGDSHPWFELHCC